MTIMSTFQIVAIFRINNILLRKSFTRSIRKNYHDSLGSNITSKNIILLLALVNYEGRNKWRKNIPNMKFMGLNL
jgi:hypothetical protein